MSYYCKGEICPRAKKCLRATAWEIFPKNSTAAGMWFVTENTCIKNNYEDGIFKNNKAMESKILQAKSQNQKNVILKILEDDNPTTYHNFEDGDVENMMIDGNISFDSMAKIVDYLRLNIKKGVWYKCVKDVMDNKCEVRLFTKGEYYLCPKDGMLITDNNKTMQWQEWHHPEDCFVEEIHITYK